MEPLVGSPVDFVLSDMEQWPNSADHRGEPVREDSPAKGASPSFVTAAQRRGVWASKPARLALWTGAALLVIAFVLQVALTRRSWIAAHAPALAPVLGALCQPLGCTVAPYRFLDAIVIDSSAFNRSGPAAFRFTVTLRNQSDVSVATPALELILTDALNQTVVRRVIAPGELDAPLMLAPRGEFAGANSLELTGVENASAITGYLVTAFYP